MTIMGGGCVQNSCSHQPSSSQSGFVDESDQIFGAVDLERVLQNYAGFDSVFDPDSIWHDIDEIIAENAVVANRAGQQRRQQPQRPRFKLVRKRKYRRVRPAQLHCDYGRERLKGPAKEFAEPKTYECQYCLSEMLSVHVYVQHLKRHREAELRRRMSRCNACGWLFFDVIQTRWHQIQCLKRTIVGNL